MREKNNVNESSAFPIVPSFLFQQPNGQSLDKKLILSLMG